MPRPKYKVGLAAVYLSTGKPDTPPPAPCTTRICTQEEIETMLSKYDLRAPEKKPVMPGSNPKRREVKTDANVDRTATA